MRVALSLLLLVVGCSAARPRPPGEHEASLIVTCWCGPPLERFDDERAAQLAAAGFTDVGPPCEGALDPALTRLALDVAARHGLRLWIADHRLTPGIVEAPDWLASIDAAVADYAAYPALAGYMVADEPTVQQFDAVAALVAALRAADPRHPAYVNLLPDYIPPRLLGAESYRDYLERFIATVHPPLLSYDYYPFGHDKDRSTFFANLSAVRAAALARDLPFMLIVLVMPHGPYRDPNEAELAWQVFHAVAFGARGISYFTYWTPPPGDAEWNNHNGLIEDGRPTLHYFQVARLNHTVRAMGQALASYRSIAVADPLGEIGAPFPIGPIEAIDGGPVTAGLFGDDAGGLALLLVNRDYRYGVTARLRLRPGAGTPQVLDTAAERWDAPADPSFPLAPGEARLLRWTAP